MNFNRKPVKRLEKPLVDEQGRPLQVTVSGNDFLALCQRAKEGEFEIPSITLQGNAEWIVTLRYPTPF